MITLDSLTKGAVINAPRIVILGVEKIGKSTFACGSRFDKGKLVEIGLNKPVVISTKGEQGVDALDVAKFPTANTFTDVYDSAEALLREDHKHETVVIDSASALEPIIWSDLCLEHNVPTIEQVAGGFGKGYIEAAQRWGFLLAKLDELREVKNMASILIGHVKVKRFNDPNGESYDQYQFDVNEKVSNLLFRWADLIIFANTKTVVQKEDVGFKKKTQKGKDITNGQRFGFTQKRPAHPGGGRGAFGSLPYEIPLDWASFEAAVAATMPVSK